MTNIPPFLCDLFDQRHKKTTQMSGFPAEKGPRIIFLPQPTLPERVPLLSPIHLHIQLGLFYQY